MRRTALLLFIFLLGMFLPVVLCQAYTNVSVIEAKTMIDSNPALVILDVRDQSEYDDGHIRNAKLIPNTELIGRLGELNPTDPILVYCRLGGRSATASQTLVDNGFLFVYNMLGGISAWTTEGYPVFVKYSSIQDAINNANGGDTLHVSSSTYYENIVVNKELSIVGENSENTIINGGILDPSVRIAANNSVLQDFKLNSTEEYKIAISGCKNVTISSNNILGGYGILIENSENITIEKNHVANCEFNGVSLVSSMNIRIVSNEILGSSVSPLYPLSTGYAISLENSSLNVIENNSVFDSDFGIYLTNSNRNNVTNNVVSDFYFEDLHAGNGIAILHSSSNNTISNNDISKMSFYGILVNQSSNNFFIRNSILNCEVAAFTLQLSNYNLVDGNLFENNEVLALEMNGSNFNSVYHNSFINNNNHTFLSDSSGNIWDNGYPSGGNYWDDYSGTDFYNGLFQNETGSDGIGDIPYDLDDSNQDKYPLINSNRLRWDITGDGYVGIDDIVLVAEHFGQDPAHPAWNSKHDVTGDNYIGIDDIVSVAEHFGEST